jgi:excisionase family DNA binding protein
MPSFLTYDQVAEQLHVPVATVRYWVSVNKLPAYKPGRHPLVKPADLEKFVEASELGKVRAQRARATRTARKGTP